MSQTEPRHPRFEFGQFPWVFSLHLTEPGPAEKTLRVEARNISRVGLKFVSNRKIPLFEQVQMVIFDKVSGKEVVTLLGKVVRVEEVDTGTGERTYGMAVEFLSGSPILDKLLPERASDENGTGE